MIFVDCKFGLRLIGRAVSVKLPIDLDTQADAGKALVHYRYDDESRESNIDLGVRSLDQPLNIPAPGDRDAGVIIETTPWIGGNSQVFDRYSHQVVRLKTPHNDQKPKIFLCGSATAKRVRIGVMNYNRFAVLRRVQISESSDFSDPFTYDIYYDWPGTRIPAPIPNEFLIKRTSTGDGATIYVRVAHSATLQSPLSQESPLGGFPVYIYGRRPQMSEWSATLSVTWPGVLTASGIESPNGIADFVNDDSGLETGIGLKVIHPGSTEYTDESLLATGLLDGLGVAGRITRWVDTDSLDASPVSVDDDGVISGVGDPVAAQDAATKAFVDTSTLNFVIDGGGAVIATGVKGDVILDFDCTLLGVTMLANESGSIVVEIEKCTYADFDGGVTHPVTGDKITSSTPPTITANTKSADGTLASWITNFSANDVLRFTVLSVTSITRCTVALTLQRR